VQHETTIGPLHVGAAGIDITPDRPVGLVGQLYPRISAGAETPIRAEAVALEVAGTAGHSDQAVMVAIDLVGIPDLLTRELRDALRGRLDGLDVDKIILNATHTHTGPALIDAEEDADFSDGTTVVDGVQPPSAYRAFLVGKLVEVITQAWQGRAPGHVGWGLGHAVVGINRRALYADGRSVMYGKVDTDDFRGIEGYEDHTVEVLCFWNRAKELIATTINIACPSQEVEHLTQISADFWDVVRNQLRAEHGAGLAILGWVAAAGDQSPHLMLRKDAEERMRRLRGLSRLEEIGARVVQGWQEAYQGARQELHDEVVLAHHTWTSHLPVRQVTEAERDAAVTKLAELAAEEDQARVSPMVSWTRGVVDRYATQTPDQTYPSTLHALRLGDIAIATNQFELFTDFGLQLKGRSPALQTFVVQLAGPGTYLPTARAAAGGGYSAIVQSNQVGPDGGQQLVEETLAVLKDFWTD